MQMEFILNFTLSLLYLLSIFSILRPFPPLDLFFRSLPLRCSGIVGELGLRSLFAKPLLPARSQRERRGELRSSPSLQSHRGDGAKLLGSFAPQLHRSNERKATEKEQKASSKKENEPKVFCVVG
jgi:hypothetical protein